ncbi:concanavalin A-like lectin/glucanase domain-containing protein, partial [Syncephalastrum racemosum]
MKTSLLCLATLLSPLASAWTLKEDYSGSGFFDNFDFFTDADPTHGTVNYVNQETATSQHLAFVQNGQVIIKADNTTSNPANGNRNSVRITSKATFNQGSLFVFDVNHMPTGCGTWPAMWLVGPNWPHGGEIDIVENVNNLNFNQYTLHTGPGCTMQGVNREQTAIPLDPANCDVTNDPTNAGCGNKDQESVGSFGAPFNNNGGGVFATSWTADGIKIWFFPRGKIPADINNKAPTPASWGTPNADFPFTQCQASDFSEMQIVINLTFCGDWAGNVFSQDGCPGNCADLVKSSPAAFDEAFFRINNVRHYLQ